ncbi:MAG: hypothetical protein IKZ73_05620, partial [Lachnospiraceae bacterium]|nr:hypothetical protein [Lachnospiraceae bacterium]
MNANHLLRYVLLGALTAVWLFLAFDNRDIVIESIKKTVNKESSFEEARDDITQTYPERIGEVGGLIDLNGLFVRITGGRECNNVVKMY